MNIETLMHIYKLLAQDEEAMNLARKSVRDVIEARKECGAPKSEIEHLEKDYESVESAYFKASRAFDDFKAKEWN